MIKDISRRPAAARRLMTIISVTMVRLMRSFVRLKLRDPSTRIGVCHRSSWAEPVKSAGRRLRSVADEVETGLTWAVVHDIL